MRPFEIGVQSGALKGATNYTTNGGLAKAAARGFQADKNLARRTRWTNLAQILNQSRAYIFRQRQSFQSLAFAAPSRPTSWPILLRRANPGGLKAARLRSHAGRTLCCDRSSAGVA